MYRIKNKSVILITTAYSGIPNVFPKKNKNKKIIKKKKYLLHWLFDKKNNNIKRYLTKFCLHSSRLIIKTV